jgi:acyl-CoA reductase-like NAD-dependent aldehyde dehydrogenase
MKTNNLMVNKTHKMYIKGAFVRSESNRTLKLNLGGEIKNIPYSSRKDLRNAVEASKGGYKKFSSATAYNRGQILYRMAEMLSDRFSEALDIVAEQYSGWSGDAISKPLKPEDEIKKVIDRIIWYAGWTDKVGPLYSSLNPVVSPMLNFTHWLPMGNICVVPGANATLLSTLSLVLPILVSGNSVVLVMNYQQGPLATFLAELLHTSDVPAGVVNILTGKPEEVLEVYAEHKEINAVYTSNLTKEEEKTIRMLATSNLKRVYHLNNSSLSDWKDDDKSQSPEMILNFCEAKTVWHPIGCSIGQSSSY